MKPELLFTFICNWSSSAFTGRGCWVKQRAHVI